MKKKKYLLYMTKFNNNGNLPQDSVTRVSVACCLVGWRRMNGAQTVALSLWSVLSQEAVARSNGTAWNGRGGMTESTPPKLRVIRLADYNHTGSLYLNPAPPPCGGVIFYVFFL